MTVFRRLVNEELVSAGFAWVYPRYCDRPICERWKVLEDEAREAKRGLWADPHAIPPGGLGRKVESGYHDRENHQWRPDSCGSGYSR